MPNWGNGYKVNIYSNCKGVTLQNKKSLAYKTFLNLNWKKYAIRQGHAEWSRNDSFKYYLKKYTLNHTHDIENYVNPQRNDMAVCICFFSFCNYNNTIRNLLIVLNDLQKAKIPYFIIELLYPKQISIVPNPTIIAHAETVMFHKENLLNVLEKIIPSKFSKLMFLDCDIRFTMTNWYDENSKLLDESNVIQPMEFVKSNTIGNKSSIATIAKSPYEKEINLMNYHPGYALGIDRTLFHKIGGFYDKAVIGSGDTIFWNSIFKAMNLPTIKAEQSAKHTQAYKDINLYERKIETNKKDLKINFLKNNYAIHLPHGSFKNRHYGDRSNGWDIKNIDLYKNKYGIYEFKNEKLNKYMQSYFQNRKEDN